MLLDGSVDLDLLASVLRDGHRYLGVHQVVPAVRVCDDRGYLLDRTTCDQNGRDVGHLKLTVLGDDDFTGQLGFPDDLDA